MNDAPVLHHRHLVTEFQGLAQVVSDEDDGLVDSALQFHQFVLHLAAYERVEGAERLIHQQYLRVLGQGSCEAHPLLHTAAEVVWVVITPTAKPHHFQCLKSFLVAFLGGDSLHLQSILHVFSDSLVGEQSEMLEYHAHLVAADFPQVLAIGDSDFFFVYEYPPGGRRNEAVDAPDERGFA